MFLEKLRNIPGCEYFSKMERVAQSENCRASLGFLRKMKTFSFNDNQQITKSNILKCTKYFYLYLVDFILSQLSLSHTLTRSLSIEYRFKHLNGQRKY